MFYLRCLDKQIAKKIVRFRKLKCIQFCWQFW